MFNFDILATKSEETPLDVAEVLSDARDTMVLVDNYKQDDLHYVEAVADGMVNLGMIACAVQEFGSHETLGAIYGEELLQRVPSLTTGDKEAVIAELEHCSTEGWSADVIQWVKNALARLVELIMSVARKFKKVEDSIAQLLATANGQGFEVDAEKLAGKGVLGFEKAKFESIITNIAAPSQAVAGVDIAAKAKAQDKSIAVVRKELGTEIAGKLNGKACWEFDGEKLKLKLAKDYVRNQKSIKDLGFDVAGIKAKANDVIGVIKFMDDLKKVPNGLKDKLKDGENKDAAKLGISLVSGMISTELGVRGALGVQQLTMLKALVASKKVAEKKPKENKEEKGEKGGEE